MRALLKNKDFLKTFERIFCVTIGCIMVAFMLWKAPDQATKIIDMSGVLLVGAKLNEKFGL